MPSKKWSMYSKLHDDVAMLLHEDNLTFKSSDTNDDVTCKKTFDTNIMGRFICCNKNCSVRGWSSNFLL
jgi:hypothetical protein